MSGLCGVQVCGFIGLCGVGFSGVSSWHCEVSWRCGDALQQGLGIKNATCGECEKDQAHA